MYDPDADRVLTGATLVFGFDPGRRVGTFAELAAFGTPVGPASVVFHTGYTLLVAETLQIDMHSGVGLTDSAPDAFVAAGASVRF